jgi:hypothetical protein
VILAAQLRTPDRSPQRARRPAPPPRGTFLCRKCSPRPANPRTQRATMAPSARRATRTQRPLMRSYRPRSCQSYVRDHEEAHEGTNRIATAGNPIAVGISRHDATAGHTRYERLTALAVWGSRGDRDWRHRPPRLAGGANRGAVANTLAGNVGGVEVFRTSATASTHWRDAPQGQDHLGRRFPRGCSAHAASGTR